MKVLLILAAVLLVLLLLPFGGAVRYDQAGTAAFVTVGPFRFKVYPARAKKEKPKKPKKPKKEPEKKGGRLEAVRAALPLISPALSGVKKRLVINDLEVQVVWAADDPADAATGYGYASAAMGALWPVIDQNFTVKKSRLGTGVDFDAGEPTVYLFAKLSLNLWKVLTLVLPLAVRFFVNYTRLKGEAEKSMKKEA